MKSYALPLLAVMILAGVLVAAPDFAGTWTGKTDIPNIGTDDLTLVIQKKEDPQTKTVVFSAVLSDTLGYVAPATEVKEIKVAGSEMTFQFPLVDGSVIAGKLAFKDETLVGSWANDEGMAAEMRFERKK
jgi:hypothetical protein